MTKTDDFWKVLDDFRDWLHEQKKLTAELKWKEAGCPQNQDVHFWFEAEKEFPLPQIIREIMGSGYGADDPFLKTIIENYKARYETQ